MSREFIASRIIAPTHLPVANDGALDDTGVLRRRLLPRIAICRITCSDGPNAVKTESRAVDGGLAQPDAGGRGRRPRGNAPTQRLSDHGNTIGAWPRDALSPDPRCRRLRG